MGATLLHPPHICHRPPPSHPLHRHPPRRVITHRVAKGSRAEPPSVEGERYGVGKWGRIATARLLPHRAELQGLSREPKVMRESLLIIFKRNFQGKFILKIINRPHRPSLEGLPAWTPFCRNFASAISQRRLTHKR